tara:strand:+ start:722 stop:973 length:252 start_codon:yes stop_codon:yes gene_type:complete
METFTTRYLVDHKEHPDGLYVVVEQSPAEPDVGFNGNGKICIAVEHVFKDDGHGHPLGDCIMEDFSDLAIEDIAQTIYDQIGK